MPDTTSRKLVLERRGQQDKTARIGPAMVTPAIDEDYWSYRVRLTDTQAIVGFPKFGTIGIGFAQEEDWNTNLPFTCDADEIYGHIAHNKADDSITDAECVQAIGLIQEAIAADRTPAPEPEPEPTPVPLAADRFDVKRSGANITLVCRRCNRRVASWQVESLDTITDTAAAHQLTQHADAEA